jgi:hypothetical protein
MLVNVPLGLIGPKSVSLTFGGRQAGQRHFSRWAFVALAETNDWKMTGIFCGYQSYLSLKNDQMTTLFPSI